MNTNQFIQLTLQIIFLKNYRKMHIIAVIALIISSKPEIFGGKSSKLVQVIGPNIM